MKLIPLMVSGGALAAITAAFFGYRKAAQTEKSVEDAVAGAGPETKNKIDTATTPKAVQEAVEQAAPPAPPDVLAAAEQGDVEKVKKSSWYTGQVKLRLTGYWPFTAKPSEQKMEGGVHDRKGYPLHTLEDFFAGKSDHVSLSGDDGAWPYGQKITFAWSDGRTVVGRVTDTGRNFRGSNKVYRALGNEPIDVCVYSKEMHPPTFVTATIVKGDTLDKPGKAVVVSKFKGQKVEVGWLHLLGAVNDLKRPMGKVIPLVNCAERGKEFSRQRDAGALEMLGAA